VFPPSIRTDPKFIAASKACANLLVRPGAGGTGTSTTASA
jgi:hypothetical protein